MDHTHPSPSRIARQFLSKELGDHAAPLEANLPEDLQRDHELVGELCRISEHTKEAPSEMIGKKGRVMAVIVKRSQIAGYEVEIKDTETRVVLPKRAVYVGRRMVDDVHLDSAEAQHVKELISHSRAQHDFPGTSWDGVERLCFELAKATDYLAVQSAGWYKYPGSTRPDMDGKDWRYMWPGTREAVVVNCHSLLHDHVWTLTTTVFSTRDIETAGIRGLGHRDHWTRTLLWTIETARVLQTDGYDYGSAIAEMESRLRRNRVLYRIVRKLFPQVSAACREVVGKPCDPPPLSIGFGTTRLSATAVGRHEPPTDAVPYSIITVSPDATGPYLVEVVKHELIHYLLGRHSMPGSHHDAFHEIAKRVGLPREYRD